MNFIHAIICGALIGFMAGLVHTTQQTEVIIEQKEIPSTKVHNGRLTDSVNASVNWDDPNLGQPIVTHEHDLKPCSEVETMPCETSPRNPVREQLEATKERPGLFKKDEAVTCIYPAIFWWTDKSEFVKTVAMKCTVVQASEAFDDLEKDYQHVQVDCSKDIDFQSSSQPGVGMVKGHKLMFKVRWMPSTDCYHFQQQ